MKLTEGMKGFICAGVKKEELKFVEYQLHFIEKRSEELEIVYIPSQRLALRNGQIVCSRTYFVPFEYDYKDYKKAKLLEWFKAGYIGEYEYLTL